VRRGVKGKNNKVLFNDTVIASIEAGEEAEYEYRYTHPDSLSGLKLTFEIYANAFDEYNIDNNRFEVAFGETDIAISDVTLREAVIVNRGYTAANDVVLEVRDGSSTAAVIASVGLGTINAGAQKTASISIPAEYLNPGKNGRSFFYSVTSSTPEVLLADNDTIVELGAPKTTGISIDKDAVTVGAGKSKVLAATVVSESGASEEVRWNSSDVDIVKVDGAGKITGVSEGEADVTVVTLDTGIAAVCHVTVVGSADVFELTQISATAYNKLKLDWTAYSGADGYLVYRKTGTDDLALIKSISGKDNTSFTNAVTSGVEYTYQVKAYKLEGTKKTTIAETDVMNATALPAAPSFTSAKMAAYNKIRLIWEKVSGCEGYVLYRSESEGGKYSVLKTVTQATATNYVNVVRDSKTYYYKLRAFVTVDGKKVYGDYSDILSANVISGPPQNFALEKKTATKIAFTWYKVGDADGYVIYIYYPDTGKYKATKNIADVNTLTYTKKVTKGESYQFAIRSYRLIDGVKIYSDYGPIITN
jgi:hypothetical protein